jgi:hypothetical protein
MGYVVLAAAIAILVSGCTAVPVAQLESEADRLRDAAMEAFEAGDRKTPLELSPRALAITAQLPATSWRTVENYDDAGLYHYGVGDWEQSARHQAIAVLLACGTSENAPTFPTYVERLRWAFAKYRPHQDFRAILENPLVLLHDPALRLRSNADIQRRYYLRYPAPNVSRSSQVKYLFKLRGSAPRTCAPAAG